MVEKIKQLLGLFLTFEYVPCYLKSIEGSRADLWTIVLFVFFVKCKQSQYNTEIIVSYTSFKHFDWSANQISLALINDENFFIS